MAPNGIGSRAVALPLAALHEHVRLPGRQGAPYVGPMQPSQPTVPTRRRRSLAGVPAALLVAALLVTGAASPAASGPAAPSDAADFAWRMAPGAQLPLDTPLTDEAGRAVRLQDAFGVRPVVLDLGYFHCPSLCGVVRNDLFRALQASGLKGGEDYTLVALSIDPAETPRDAAEAKAADLAQAPFATGDGWHYWTGSAPALAAVEAAVGFRARYDAEFKQFLHPAGLVVLTRGGVVSGYLQGVGYAGGDLRTAVLRAGEGGIAQAALPILLLCFHFDAATGRYTLAIEKVLRLMALFTVAIIGGLLLVLHRRGAAR